MQQLWERLSTSARIGLAAGCLLIVGLVGGLAVWAYRPDYQVLFADMAPRDAAAMAAELDKLKTPYRLADNGNTILVPRDLVYKTRLQVMGKEIPLQGAVGFEVFNNADFGVTDFVQKVNYQRAIQGELTRTILSIEGVASARVHLAIPDQGLFKKAVTKPKASVTVAMKQGHALVPEQVQGIQRLVAASVPDIASADVTVLDQHGVALTRPAHGADGAWDGALAQLDSKRSAEEYLYKKVAQVLDRTFGPGEAIASVDLVLNLDQHKLTTEEVLPSRAATADASPAGVVVRERHVSREGEGANATQSGATTTDEADYQVGRRVEQVSTASGTIRRMTVAVVVKKPMSEEQMARLRDVIAVAAGFNQARGDAIVVSTLGSLVSQAAASPGEQPVAAAAPVAAEALTAPVSGAPDKAFGWSPAWLLALLPLGAAIGLTLRRRRTVPAPRLGEHERARLVTEVRQWIDVPATAVVEQK